MRFTVIMACYNRKNYIEKAIWSVMTQTFINWELIIVDDGSTDGTPIFIKQFLRDKRIKLIKKPTNTGVGSCHQISAGIARGEIIATLDSDDELMPDALMKVDQVYRRFPEAGIVYSKLAFCNEFMRRTGQTTGSPLKGSYYAWAKNNPHGSVVPALRTFKKYLYDLTEGYSNYLNGEDKDILIKLEEVGAKFYFINEVLYLYRRHSNSIGRTKKKDFMPQVLVDAARRRK